MGKGRTPGSAEAASGKFKNAPDTIEDTKRRDEGGPRLGLKLAEEIDRTTFLLALCESDRKNATEKVSSKFTANLETAFQDLNRNLDWISYATNDLPVIRDLPAIVKQAAIENKLNKSQTKALKDAYGKNPEKTKKLLTDKKATVTNRDTQTDEDVPLAELSAAMSRVCRPGATSVKFS